MEKGCFKNDRKDEPNNVDSHENASTKDGHWETGNVNELSASTKSNPQNPRVCQVDGVCHSGEWSEGMPAEDTADDATVTRQTEPYYGSQHKCPYGPV